MLIRCFGQNTNDAFDRCLLPECQTSRETPDNRSWGRPLPVSLSHEEVSFGGWLREWFRRPESRMDRGIRRPDSSQAGSRRLQGDRPEARQRNRAAGIVGRDRQIEKRGAIVVARRLMQVGGQVLRYAIAGGLATRDPSQDIRGALRSAAPRKHRTALKEVDLPEFPSMPANGFSA